MTTSNRSNLSNVWGAGIAVCRLVGGSPRLTDRGDVSLLLQHVDNSMPRSLQARKARKTLLKHCLELGGTMDWRDWWLYSPAVVAAFDWSWAWVRSSIDHVSWYERCQNHVRPGSDRRRLGNIVRIELALYNEPSSGSIPSNVINCWEKCSHTSKGSTHYFFVILHLICKEKKSSCTTGSNERV